MCTTWYPLTQFQKYIAAEKARQQKQILIAQDSGVTRTNVTVTTSPQTAPTTPLITMTPPLTKRWSMSSVSTLSVGSQHSSPYLIPTQQLSPKLMGRPVQVISQSEDKTMAPTITILLPDDNFTLPPPASQKRSII